MTLPHFHGQSLQDAAFADGTCYGCGPVHPTGLHLKSYWDDDGVHVVARHMPRPEFIGFPGLVYGGLTAMLIDCHSCWTAVAAHYKAEEREAGSAPRIDCVTGQMSIDYLKAGDVEAEIFLKARVEGPIERKTRVVCEVWSGDLLIAKGQTLFVRVDTEKLRALAHGNRAPA